MAKRPIQGNPDGASTSCEVCNIGEPRMPSERAHQRRRLDRLRPVLTSILVATLIITITPLAFASPVDPTYIAGLYDGADYDDVIELLTDTNSVAHPGPPLTAQPLSIVVASVHTWFAAPSNAASLWGGRLLRSPPTATVKVVFRK